MDKEWRHLTSRNQHTLPIRTSCASQPYQISLVKDLVPTPPVLLPTTTGKRQLLTTPVAPSLAAGSGNRVGHMPSPPSASEGGILSSDWTTKGNSSLSGTANSTTDCGSTGRLNHPVGPRWLVRVNCGKKS